MARREDEDVRDEEDEEDEEMEEQEEEDERQSNLLAWDSEKLVQKIEKPEHVDFDEDDDEDDEEPSDEEIRRIDDEEPGDGWDVPILGDDDDEEDEDFGRWDRNDVKPKGKGNAR